MQEAVPLGKGAMIAVLGLKTNEIQNLIKNREKKRGICEIANDNADGQVIVSGDKEDISDFQKDLKEKNIKTIPLKVSAPFHCMLMKPAAEKMKEKINNINFNSPKVDIINNVTAKPVNESEKIKKLLIDQIFSTVRWRESLLNMHENSVNNFIEIGPGKVLTGMVKRTIKGANCFSINSIADIKNLNDKFKDKKVFITGATGGIGKNLTKKFYDLGAKIVGSGTNEEKLNNLKNEFSGIDVEKFKLEEHDKIEELVNKIDKKLDGIDILINNAGITLDNLSIRLTQEN